MGLTAAFNRFWLGETLSLLGTQVTVLALPLTAILILDASPGQLGLLGAAQFLPYLLFTMLAGAWLDRRRRRPALVAAHLVRALLIGLVPAAALLGLLQFEWLLVAVFLVGSLTVVYEVGWLAYLPSIVDRSRLVAANSRLVASSSAAQVGGPGLAGLLIAIVSAPFALVLDAVSYLVAAASLASIRTPEATPAEGTPRPPLLRDMLDGLQTTFRSSILRAFALEAATYNVFATIVTTLLVLFALRELGLDPATIGLVLSVGAVGALLGSVVAAPVARRLGLGRALVAAMVVACAASLAIPFAGGPPIVAAGLLAAVFFVEGFGVAISVVHVVSIRQAVTPDDGLAKMNGAYRTLTYGAIPLGALLGGFLAESIGLRATIAVAAVIIAAAPLWVIRSPIPGIRSLDEAIERYGPASTALDHAARRIDGARGAVVASGAA